MVNAVVVRVRSGDDDPVSKSISILIQMNVIPGNPHMSLVSMGIYVFSTDYLREQLEIDAENTESSHDFGKDVIPKALAAGHNIQSYAFNNPVQDMEPYWRDVGTLDAYYMANMEIIAPDPPLDVYDPDWQIVTYQPQLPLAVPSVSGERGAQGPFLLRRPIGKTEDERFHGSGQLVQ